MHWLDDLRIAVRSLGRTPGFTALATSVLALGLAVVVIMFGLLYTIAYVPPPVPDPDSMVGIKTMNRNQGQTDNDVRPHDFADWRAQQTVFEDMAGDYQGTVIVGDERSVERYDGGFVTGKFFELMRIPAFLGRGIEPADALPGAAPVVALSYDLWRTRYDQDPKIIGQTLRVNGLTATVVGVMPKAFDLPAGSTLWVPIPEPYDVGPRTEGVTMAIIARLKPGVTIDTAQAQLATISANLAKRYPETNAGIEPDVMPIAMVQIGRDDVQLIQTLFGSVLLVLLIACVNVAGLMLVRATARTQEAGIRRALGAGRRRLALQMLAEAFVIGGLAALLGLTLAGAGLEVLSRILPAFVESPPSWWDFRVDGRVALFAVGLAVISTLIAGVYPAIRVSGIDVNAVVREGTRDTGLSTGRIIRWLVVAEIALSCALLTSAGIMIRAAIFATNGNLGVDTRPLMTGRIGLPEPSYPKERQRQFIEQLLPALQAIPGARAATIVTAPPGWGTGREPFMFPDRTYAQQTDYPYARMVSTAPGLFDTLGLRIIAGRDFTVHDRADTPMVALVSEEFVRQYWPNAQPLGQRLRLRPADPESPWMTVVGVVPNVLHDDEPFEGGKPQATIYSSLLQQPERFMSAMLSTAGSPHALGPAIRDVVRRLDPDLAVYWVRTIPEARRAKSGGLYILGGMFVIFGFVTIVLSASGIYGVLAYSVAQSAREIAIRRALGAPDGGIVRALAWRSGWQLALGLAIGILLAPLISTLFGAALGGTNVHDVRVYSMVGLILLLSITAATIVPVHRALRLQPIAALRHT